MNREEIAYDVYGLVLELQDVVVSLIAPNKDDARWRRVMLRKLRRFRDEVQRIIDDLERLS